MHILTILKLFLIGLLKAHKSVIMAAVLLVEVIIV